VEPQGSAHDACSCSAPALAPALAPATAIWQLLSTCSAIGSTCLASASEDAALEHPRRAPAMAFTALSASFVVRSRSMRGLIRVPGDASTKHARNAGQQSCNICFGHAQTSAKASKSSGMNPSAQHSSSSSRYRPRSMYVIR
jgi:hypothetical protein